MVLHGVQSHGGWYHRLGRRFPRPVTPPRFPTGAAPAPISAIAAIRPSARRLIRDLVEWMQAVRHEQPGLPLARGRNQLGREARGDPGGQASGAGRCLRADLSGPASARGRLRPGAAGDRLGVASRIDRKTVSDPAVGPALFTDSPEGQAFIAPTRWACVRRPPGCWRPAS